MSIFVFLTAIKLAWNRSFVPNVAKKSEAGLTKSFAAMLVEMFGTTSKTPTPPIM
jgi:hypothetical protein